MHQTKPLCHQQKGTNLNVNVLMQHTDDGNARYAMNGVMQHTDDGHARYAMNGVMQHIGYGDA